jgi:hypothetical protein
MNEILKATLIGLAFGTILVQVLKKTLRAADFKRTRIAVLSVAAFLGLIQLMPADDFDRAFGFSLVAVALPAGISIAASEFRRRLDLQRLAPYEREMEQFFAHQKN